MIYRSIGLMSGSSLDGLDIVFAEFSENAGNWNGQILEAECLDYSSEWRSTLQHATELPAFEYMQLHVDYGHFLGECVNTFIQKKGIIHQVGLVSSHGHTTFHNPKSRLTHQLGDGAAIAAELRLPVVSDLRNLDVAFGGQGAPIVPKGEQLLFPDFKYFLNIGGICNLSIHISDSAEAFDISPANRVLNILAKEAGKDYDEDGKIASSGMIDGPLLAKLNQDPYYQLKPPKSLANSFGTDVLYPLIKSSDIDLADKMATFSEHISSQVAESLKSHIKNETQVLFISGGGAFNLDLIRRIENRLKEINFEIYIPDDSVVSFKEAYIMSLLGVLRWREENTIDCKVTGAKASSIGGALWLGSEA